MSAANTSRTRIVKRVSHWPQPGHGHARPDCYPASPSKALSSLKASVIVAQASPRPNSARLHPAAVASHLASTVNTAIKSP